MKILISSYHMNQALSKFKERLKREKIYFDTLIRNPSVKEKDLIKIIHKYDGIICSDDELTKKVLTKATKLKVISKWGTGIDSIDTNFAKKKGIKIFNTPNAFTEGVAQHAWGLILNLTKRISENDRDIKNGYWKKYEGTNIEGKKIGVIGLGKIGSKIIQYSSGFNVVIYGNDKNKEVQKKFKKKGIIIKSIKNIIKKCDIVILSVDLNPSSYNLIGKKEISLFNFNKILINISRGQVVNNQELAKAIKKNTIRIGFDVFEEEPLKKKLSNILKINNSISTSHNAFNTKEEVDFVHKNTVENLIKGLKS